MSTSTGTPAGSDGVPSRHSGSFVATFFGAFVLFAAVGGAVSFLTESRLSTAPIVQPVRFNHQVHVEGEGLECVDCHNGCEDGIRSGIPDVETCAMCHSEAIGESAEEQRLVTMIENGESLDWQPLFRQPPHIFFSHRRHVTVGGLECATCHGDIGMSQAPPERVTRLRMDDCLECHLREGVTDSCTSCHR